MDELRAEAIPIGAAHFGRRIAQLVRSIEAVTTQQVTQELWGLLVAKEEGRRQPYRRSTVNEWMANVAVPTLSAFEAMARIARRYLGPTWTAGFIAFGEGPEHMQTLALQAVRRMPLSDLGRVAEPPAAELEAPAPRRSRAAGKQSKRSR